MRPVNNVNTSGMTKKQAKKMQKMLDTLQKEMAETILLTMQQKGEPMEMAEIIAAFPDNERRRSCKNDQELKLYVSMGLGRLIRDGSVRELPKTADGKHLLAVV